MHRTGRSLPGAGAFQVLLTQGVVDTVAETLFVGGCTSCEPLVNVSELWSASQASGTSWVAIRATDDAAWSQVRVGDDVRQRIQQDLKAGYTVLVPSKAVSLAGQTRVGWWRVEPRSGSTLGVMESGQGPRSELTPTNTVGQELLAVGSIPMSSSPPSRASGVRGR